MALLSFFFRVFLFVGLIALACVLIVFSAWNADQLILIRTPIGGDRFRLIYLLPGILLAGIMVGFFVMSALNTLEQMRWRKRERELKQQVSAKDKEIHAASVQLADYEAKTREFALQVMQITHALGAPAGGVPGPALPGSESEAGATNKLR